MRRTCVSTVRSVMWVSASRTLLDELSPREDAPARLEERPQDAELGDGQVDAAAVHAGLVAGGVEGHRPVRDCGAAAGAAAARAARRSTALTRVTSSRGPKGLGR